MQNKDLDKNEFEEKIDLTKKQPQIVGAITFGEEEKVKELIKSGFDVNFKIDEQMPLLQMAIVYGSHSIVKILIDAGANVDIRSSNEIPLTYFAIINNDIEILSILIDAGANVNVKVLGKPLIVFAIMLASSEIVELLVDSGADTNVNIDDTPLLVFSAFFTKEEIFSILLKSGLDINSKIGITYLTHYICGSNFDSINKDYQRSMIQTLKNIKEENLQTLNSLNRTKEMIKGILKLKNDTEEEIWIKRKSFFENKSLTIKNHLNFLSIKLQEIQNLAVVYEPIDAISMIKRNGANFDLIAETGETNLMFASYSGNIEVVEFLLELGADINHKSNNNETALSMAYEQNFNNIVKLLIKKGANINITLNNGKSLYDTAIFMKDFELEDLIKSSHYFILNPPKNLVKLLSNFTIDTPFKLTTHLWEDPKGELFDKYGSFDGYMSEVKKQFESMQSELEGLSPNLYKKISAFLIENTPNDKYSWCSKTDINIGWSSLEGLKEWCDSGKFPKDFKLQNPIFIGRKQIVTFGEIVDLFKQEIEVKATYHIASLPDVEFSKRDFYTDTQKFSTAIAKIFEQMKSEEYPQIKVSNKDLSEDMSIEIKITQVGSPGYKNAQSMLQEINDGDFADIKESLKNLCDWSIESSFEDENFRVNFLHSNNVKDIESLETKPLGFTHILRFYK